MNEAEYTENDFTSPVSDRARTLALTTPDGFLAFGFGSGLFTPAPGTMGTLAAVPFAILIKLLDGFLFWFVLLCLFMLGVWLCGRLSEALGVEDYGGIVWDEMLGYWLAVAFVPLQWTWLLAAFVLFRFFDIIKPWPISEIEGSFEGGMGIMLDDVAAALYTMVLLGGLQYAFFGI